MVNPSIGYNSRGEVTQYTYPDSTVVERSYTDRGQLYQLKHASTTIDTRTYDNGGRMTGSSYNNGVSESRSYNGDNTLASISYTGASIGTLSYSWDDNKNKTAESISGAMSNFGFSIPSGGYDDEDRLVTFNRTDGNLDQSWSLSDVGDWDSITTEGVSQSRTHGDTHELLTVGASNVSTDVKGNITLIPASARPNNASLTSVWDQDNRLVEAWWYYAPDDLYDYSIHIYDALGRRVGRKFERYENFERDNGGHPKGTWTSDIYVQCGQQTIADYVSGTAASSPTHRYVYASYIDEPVLRFKPAGSESLYYHRNQQYSVTALTNGSGTIVERYAYSAYGVPLIFDAAGTTPRSVSSYNNRYMYTGREWDPVIVQYHYRARMYDPALGRFCSRDPIGYVDGANLFASYFAMLYVDPNGLCQINCCCCAESLLLKDGPRELNKAPIEVDPERAPGIGHDFALDATMSFYQTDGPTYVCRAYWWEYYFAGRYGWWLSGDPDRRDKIRKDPIRVPPTGGTMGDFWDFMDEFRAEGFDCEGEKTVRLRDKPFAPNTQLNDSVRRLYFHVVLESGLGCACVNRSIVWEGCQVIGYRNGKKVSYFGSSKSECTRQAIAAKVGEWWQHEWPEFNR